METAQRFYFCEWNNRILLHGIGFEARFRDLMKYLFTWKISPLWVWSDYCAKFIPQGRNVKHIDVLDTSCFSMTKYSIGLSLGYSSLTDYIVNKFRNCRLIIVFRLHNIRVQRSQYIYVSPLNSWNMECFT